jgi:hypothetical protein
LGVLLCPLADAEQVLETARDDLAVTDYRRNEMINE